MYVQSIDLIAHEAGTVQFLVVPAFVPNEGPCAGEGPDESSINGALPNAHITWAIFVQ